MTTRERLTQTDWPDQRAMHQVLEVLYKEVIDPLEKRIEDLESALEGKPGVAEVADEEVAAAQPSEDPPTGLGNSPESPSPVGPAESPLDEAVDPTSPATRPMAPPAG